MRRWLTFWSAISAAVVASLLLGGSAGRSDRLADPERAAGHLVNGTRIARAREPVRVRASRCAHEHSKAMARTRKVFHGTCGRGEIVGAAPTLIAVHIGFWRSKAHRAWLLCRRCRRVAIGIARRDGLVYVTEVFR